MPPSETPASLPTLCRACLETWPRGLERSGRARDPCPACGLPTLRSHPELFELTTAHIDCDAFYASVEKRDRPELADKPVIIGGGKRGVVTTACYVARQFGPRSAMPMFKALRLCPDAVVIKPDMAKYSAVSRQIRALMDEVTPVVEPLSLDEAYLDLASDVRIDERAPAVALAALAKAVRATVGISISIGLAPNKFLAKLASDLDKPRGYAVIGAAEAEDVLAPMPVGAIHGIGKVTAGKLEARGITEIRQLQAMSDAELRAAFGKFGDRLAQYVRGRDPRIVKSERATKSVSAETTFNDDISDPDLLIERVGRLAERVAERLNAKGYAGRTVVLKLKTSDFQILTRNCQLAMPTQRADLMMAAAVPLIRREADGRRFRLIGIGVSDLSSGDDADPPDLFAAPARKASS